MKATKTNQHNILSKKKDNNNNSFLVEPLLDHNLHDESLNDYIKFFTTKEGTDMLPYAYLDDEGTYDNLMKDNENYYLFSDEVSIIKNNKKLLSRYLAEIDNIIEIGPGSNYTLENKTIPIIRYTENIKNYYGIDISENYLENILNYVKLHTNNVDVYPIKADFLNMANSNIDKISGKNCTIFLGSTLGNFDLKKRNIIMQQISQISKKNDILILTVDTNMDHNLVKKAYDNMNFHKLVFNIIKQFFKIYPDSADNSKYIKAVSKWHSSTSLMETYFKATQEFTLKIQDYNPILVSKNQEFKGVSVYKFYKNDISDLLINNNFEIVDVLNNSNKMRMFICKKV